MAKFNSFEEIVSWQKARELNFNIYQISAIVGRGFLRQFEAYTEPTI